MPADCHNATSGFYRDDEFYRRMVDAVWCSDYPAYVLSKDGAFLYVNVAWTQYTESSREKWLTINIQKIRHTFNHSIFDCVMQKRESAFLFQKITTVSKKVYQQLTLGTPIFDKTGEITHILVMVFPFYHITEGTTDTVEEIEQLPGEEEAKNLPTSPFLDTPVAHNPAMHRLLRMARRAAATDSACLINGATGTGKGVIAQYIHQNSARSERPMQTINCAALPDTLIESELFGYEPGAFTGAMRKGKRGAIEAAQGGTLFLDEINSLSAVAQSKLLRVLETHKIRRVGADTEIPVDFRLICATNAPLDELCRMGEFRWDLYYRLNLISLSIPPLKERREDIIPLANSFLEAICRKHKLQKMLSASSYEFLLNYDWPGNVRELRNFIERSVLLSEGDELMLEVGDYLPELRTARSDMTNSAGFNQDTFSLENYLEDVESGLLATLATRCQNTYELAELLKVNQSTIVRKLKKYHISLKKDQKTT